MFSSLTAPNNKKLKESLQNIDNIWKTYTSFEPFKKLLVSIDLKRVMKSWKIVAPVASLCCLPPLLTLIPILVCGSPYTVCIWPFLTSFYLSKEIVLMKEMDLTIFSKSAVVWDSIWIFQKNSCSPPLLTLGLPLWSPLCIWPKNFKTCFYHLFLFGFIHPN